MCDKVQAYAEEYAHTQMMDLLFSMVTEGGTTLDFAAKRAKLPPAEFAEQMRKSGYTLPQSADSSQARL